MKYFLLSLLAKLLLWVFFPSAFVMLFVDWARFGGIRDRTSKMFRLSAYLDDVKGNVLYAPLLNAWFVKRGAHQHGELETISEVTGINWIKGKITDIGIGFVGVLDWIDPGHAFKYGAPRLPYAVKPPDPSLLHRLIFCLLFLVNLIVALPILYYFGYGIYLLLKMIYG